MKAAFAWTFGAAAELAWWCAVAATVAALAAIAGAAFGWGYSAAVLQ